MSDFRHNLKLSMTSFIQVATEDCGADPQAVTQHRASQVTQPRAARVRKASDGTQDADQVEVISLKMGLRVV